MTPIYQTSTYVQDSPGKHKGFEYARTQNPTRSVLEANLAALEKGVDAVCFSSGLAAMDAVLKLLEPGDEVISTYELYGGSYRLMTQIFAKYGIKAHFLDLNDKTTLRSHINEKTKLIWIETPTNPMLSIVDIKYLCTLAQKHNIITCVDNTFASPYLQNPIDLGADLVHHSATKYLAGHSDVILGAVVSNNKELAEKLHFIQNASGAVPGPQDCFLTLRGIKTLHLRVQRACDNAMEIAAFLKKNKRVQNVYYPDYGGMISFTLKSDTKRAANRVLNRTKLFSLAESLGGVESLIGHPASMTHASIPKKDRLSIGLTDSLIRLSVGVEHVDDLISDLENALG
ncbi:UNVERIFIED_CONTAM: hypothetical protein GTU68_008347 [Idotea baltica]|nr:hypothetical protein [Idotea baltica]